MDSLQNSHLLKELQLQNLGTYWTVSAIPTKKDGSDSEQLDDSN